MTSSEVKQLQDKLVKEGYMSQAEVNTGYGIFGPKTTAALNAAESGQAPKYAPANNTSGSPYSESDYNAALKNHPIVSQYINAGNTAEMVDYASSTGDFSQLKNQFGQPFSLKEQQDAFKQAKKQDEAFYAAQKQKETADAERALAQKQADFQNYLLTSGQNFQEDKTQADQTAANSGVLFSGSRVQKEKMMQTKYAQDQDYKRAALGRDISGVAQDYQYKYGNDAAQNLSKYYKLGGNTYNANVAQGGVGSSGLSSIYKPNSYDYTGTRIGEQMATANQKASKLLANKANKLLATGYNNQL